MQSVEIKHFHGNDIRAMQQGQRSLAIVSLKCDIKRRMDDVESFIRE